MGVACSPDVANVFGMVAEEDFKFHENVKFFGRYIDDVLSIVVARHQDEALSYITPVVKYEPCEIEFDCSCVGSAYLDMWLHYDARSRRMAHKPFRKAYNRLERVPWASSHPMTLKKGTFLGEMSRLATLCSSPGYYLEACAELGLIYRARGYPEALINSWLKNNTDKRWKNRLSVKADEHDKFFILKSEFNPVWNTFDVKKLQRIVEDEWSKSVVTSNVTEDPEPLESNEGMDIEDLPALTPAIPIEPNVTLSGLYAAPYVRQRSDSPSLMEDVQPALPSVEVDQDLDSILMNHDRVLASLTPELREARIKYLSTVAGRRRWRGFKPIGVYFDDGRKVTHPYDTWYVRGKLWSAQNWVQQHMGVVPVDTDVVRYSGPINPVAFYGGIRGNVQREPTPPAEPTFDPEHTHQIEWGPADEARMIALHEESGVVSLSSLRQRSWKGYAPSRGMEALNFDIASSDFLGRRWLVAKKRTRNLGDFAFKWRKAVLKAHREHDPLVYSDVNNDPL